MDERQQRAKEAMRRRSAEKAKPNNMNQYYAVVGFFCVTMVLALGYALMNPATGFAQMPINDDSAILVHNGQGHRFTQASNQFFNDWTIADAKKLFETGLSDNQNLEVCRSGSTEVEIPESYDWREMHPECVQTPRTQDRECSASSYVLQTISAVEDHICSIGDGVPIRLSTQEMFDCDINTECARGTANRVLNWGRRRGFIADSCYASQEGECPDEHLNENECRATNQLYKIIDMCLAQEVDGIKKEIMARGPVVAQLSPYTDMLTFSEGVYMRTNESFKYGGQHILKIVGWTSSPDSGSAWIVENVWGSDWGENGYAKISSQGETTLDFYALSFGVYPKTMAEYYEEQEAANLAQAQAQESFEFSQEFELDEEVDQIFLDEMNEVIEEEEIDPEL